MKKVLFIVLLSGLLSGLFAEDIKFAGMDWGTSEEATKKILLEKGYTYDRVTSTGVFKVHGFEGKMAGRGAKLVVLFYKNRLLKIGIMLDTPEYGMFSLFDEIYTILEKRYGFAEVKSLFVSPYYKGDGYESSAFSLGKAYHFCSWNQDKAGLTVSISKRCDVELVYESTEFVQIIDSLNKDGDL